MCKNRERKGGRGEKWHREGGELEGELGKKKRRSEGKRKRKK